MAEKLKTLHEYLIPNGLGLVNSWGVFVIGQWYEIDIDIVGN